MGLPPRLTGRLTAGRNVTLTASRDTGASQLGPEPWNTEAEESTALGAVIRRQPMKIQQTEKT
jgi:hypothetical protein